MNKKKIYSIALALLLLLSMASVFAQEIAVEEDFVVAGVNPDDLFYGVDRAVERFTEMFSEEAKIAHMKERLAEAKVMIAQNKINYSLVAIKGFDKVRQRIKNQTRIQEHTKLMNNLGQKISEIARQGKLTESDRMQIKTLIETHKLRIKEESIKLISQAKNMTQEEAQILFDQEREKIRNRITIHVQKEMQQIKEGLSEGKYTLPVEDGRQLVGVSA